MNATLRRLRDIGAALALISAPAVAEEAFTPTQLRLGAEIFERN